jgi:hypothetical protein
MRRRRSARVCLLAWSCLLTSVLAGAEAHDQDSAPGEPLREVTVLASRVLDHRALARAVSGFVESHSTPGARINQIGRWHQNVCPQVTGLQPAFGDFVTREILNVARGIGAPTRPAGKKCSVNVEIVFTSDPQGLLTHIAKAYRPMLGFYPAAQVTQMTTFTRPIQAWYETGTRSMDYQPPVIGLSNGAAPADTQYNPGADSPFLTGVQVDSDVTAMGMQPSGVAGSFIKKGLRSDFMHVLIIADSARVARYSLQAIADYAAMLSLTRMAQLENCAPLPSITDLLASGCATPAPDSLTAADRAYLMALYSADLEQTLNLERGDVHERMMQQIEGK